MRTFMVSTIAACWLLFAVGADSLPPLRFGLQAPGATAQSLQDTWVPMVGNASAAMGREARVVLLQNDSDIRAAIERRLVDFIFCGPTLYNCLQATAQVSPIVSTVLFEQGVENQYLGGAILVRSSSSIKTIDDIRGRTVAVTQFNQLSGCQSQWGELLKRGLALFLDTPVVVAAQTNPNALRMLTVGVVDVAFVRPGTLENLETTGEIEPGTIRYINTMPTTSAYPLSTTAYHGSLLVALPHTSLDTRTDMAIAMMRLPVNTTRAVGISRFVPPQSYLDVLALQVNLGVLKQRTFPDLYCLTDANVYDFIVCPAGYVRVADALSTCDRVFTCPDGSTCVCSPCRRGDTAGPSARVRWIALPLTLVCVVAIAYFIGHVYRWNPSLERAAVTIDNPIVVLGHSTWGLVLSGRLHEQHVALKRVAAPPPDLDDSPFRKPSIGCGVAPQHVSTSPPLTVLDFVLLRPSLQQCARRDVLRSVAMWHPNITAVMGWWPGPQRGSKDVICVMAANKNGTLHALLRNPTVTLEPFMVVSILRDVLEALRYLHSLSQPQCGGALRTHNLLLGERYEVMVSPPLGEKQHTGDYVSLLLAPPEHLGTGSGAGQAQIPSADKPATVWSLTRRLATMRDGGSRSRHTPQSDMFAFGMLAFEVIYRVLPYSGEDMPDVAAWRPPSVDPGREHEPLHQLMQACWNPLPSARPTVAAALSILDAESHTPFADAFLAEARQCKGLLRQQLPSKVSDTLRKGGRVEPEEHPVITTVCIGILNTAGLRALLPDGEFSTTRAHLYDQFDTLALQHNLLRIRTHNDTYVAIANLHMPCEDHAARAAEFAVQVVSATRAASAGVQQGAQVRVRAGVHTAPGVSAVVGKSRPTYSVLGDAPVVALRLQETAFADCVQLSQATHELACRQRPSMIPHTLRRPEAQNVLGRRSMITYWLSTAALDG